MTWAFKYRHVPDDAGFVEPCPDWASAFQVMRDFIALVHPPVSIRSLQKECENFPIDVSASITDGEHVFSLAKVENA